jgi:integrase
MQTKRTRALDSRERPVQGIYERDGVFSAGYRCPHTRKWRIVNLTARTITDAKRERESLLAGLREGRSAAPSALTFEGAFHDWQDSRSRVLGQRTLADERHVLDRRLSALKHRRLQDVTTAEVARLLRELRDRYAEWSCVHAYRVLKGTFEHAVRRGYLTRSPLDGLARSERPTQRNARPVARLDTAILDKLVRAGRTARWRLALALAAWAGLRLGELRGLRWGDLDLDARVIHVRRSLKRDGTVAPPKTDAGVRDIPLLPDLRQMLLAWKLAAPRSGDDDYVIATADGQPVQERNLRRVLDQAKADAGLDPGDERLSWHSLRHSFASMLATDLDLPATTLARITGHTDAGFTLRAYARDARDTSAIVADVLARAKAAGVGS